MPPLAPLQSQPKHFPRGLQRRSSIGSTESAGLSSADRPIEPGDILILLRKRQPMAGLLQAALKREGIPVSGADRVALLDELAVMDLMSLVSALLQPEDDLALAEALKSPLFGFSDDDLFELTFCREGSLQQKLETAAGDCNGKYPDAAAKLADWRQIAQRLGPFDFFSHILEAEGGRKAFAARLGAECFDALDELLNLAEAFATRGLLSLSEFLVSLRRGASDVKRETDQGANEVRIMTVHGAKGLEASITILADTCSNRSASPVPVHFVEGSGGSPPIPVWAIKGTSRLPAIADVKDSLKDEEYRELGRLLYVAMTRTRDHLYVTGFHKGDLPAGCWYETVKTALASNLEERVDFQGRRVWSYGSFVQSQPLAQSLIKALVKELPPWLGRLAPAEPASPILLPSRIFSENDGIHADNKPRSASPNQARAKGVLLHRLLEVLPQLAVLERASAATAIASAFSGELPARERELAIETAFAALSNHVFARLHKKRLVEAGIAVTIKDHLGKRRGIITGQVDHIIFDEPDITILDYKSGVFQTDTGLSFRYVAQLAAYRHALTRLYSNIATIHAALLNTRSLEIHRAESSMLNAFLEQLADTPTK